MKTSVKMAVNSIDSVDGRRRPVENLSGRRRPVENLSFLLVDGRRLRADVFITP